MAKVLGIAAEDFRDEELLVPMQTLRARGHIVELAGPRKGEVRGMLGGTVEVGLSIEEIEPKACDALLLPGGDGTPGLRENQPLLDLVRSFCESGKPVGALCWAPTILAEAGLLKGARVAVCHIPDKGKYEGMRSEEVVVAAGAEIAGTGVACWKNLLTASGPRKAEAFADEFCGMLE